MKAAVVYASKYGSTEEIAEFLAEKLRQRGLPTEARSVHEMPNPGDYDALIIGSAAYMGHWMNEATEFVRRNRGVLTDRPVWLFSSGPLRIGPDNPSLDDPKLVPREIAELGPAIHPKGHRVFFGALDSTKLAFKHRALRKLPAAKAALPEGDFRDWDDIEAWAESIAYALVAPQVASAPEGGR